ncbi:carbohydrate-binding module family 5 protein [Peniophora sp. CONT]|nr:carbohydrate-binding module family 5 protein [Peniophora sp. CONT]
MVSLFVRLASLAAAAFYLVGTASAAPANFTTSLGPRKASKTQATQAAPHFVVYDDKYVTGAAPAPSVINGFNVYILSFWLSSGLADQAETWRELSADQRASIKSEYAAAGIKLLVSAFGSTGTPTSSGVDPVAAADSLAQWCKDYDLDGVDVDYEDFTAFNGGTTAAVDWLIAFTKELRVKLPVGDYILTHAPVAPWFEKGYSGGGYLAIHEAVGDLIDWYNVQFYNQGQDEYTTCSNLLTSSGGTYPGSSLFEIAANGVPLDKLVIGKPALTSDATSGGFMDASTLASCVAQAHSQGWNGGVMVWEYPDATSSWIETVRGSTWPASGGGGGTGTPTTTSAPAASSTSSSSGSCAGVSAWSGSTTYTAGNKVTYGGFLWTATQWTYNDTPGGAAGVWTKGTAC